ncbi:MAG: TolC family protein, partial [Pseudomonadota bacterium]|nr:TolC family protein [Pseudomonadota bacterium]
MSALAGGPLYAADLLDVYQLAVRQDARLKAAQAGFQASEELRPQALSALLPQVSGNAQYSRENLEINTQGFGSESGTFKSRGYSLRLDQVIYNHGFIVRLRLS